MNIYYCLVLIPIILVINKIFIKKNFLLNFSGESHQKFATKNLTPLSGGFVLLVFFFLYLPKEIYDLLIFLSLFFILGISADNNFLKSPLSRMLLQLIIILALVVSLNLRVDDIRIPYFNFKIPSSLLDGDESFYDPRLTFNKKEEWDVNALNLTRKFNENFEKLKLIKSDLIEKYSSYGPKN